MGANALLWSISLPQGLTVTFFNIGQGDSILIQGPTGADVLVDGGPDVSVLRELGTALPFWDRHLDAIVATHPDADHVTGLASVLSRYEVGTIIENGSEVATTKAWSNLVDASNQEIAHGAQHVVAQKGQRIVLGGGAYADVLYPDTDVRQLAETNAGSIVLHVVYGKASFLLTGDLPAKQELHLVADNAVDLPSTVLKAGHHGSKNSSAQEFVAAVHPQYGVFSRGCNNRYGHPSPQTVSIFNNFGIQTFDTCRDGTVTLHSDGSIVTSYP